MIILVVDVFNSRKKTPIGVKEKAHIEHMAGLGLGLELPQSSHLFEDDKSRKEKLSAKLTATGSPEVMRNLESLLETMDSMDSLLVPFICRSITFHQIKAYPSKCEAIEAKTETESKSSWQTEVETEGVSALKTPRPNEIIPGKSRTILDLIKSTLVPHG
ncbi:hypothetical protein CR513_34250, partial [Mucuna pruriens]